jgi:ribosome-associated protein
LTSRQTAKSIARFASEKKAEDIVVLDMRKIVNYCDYFVLCSGNTDRHARAIADDIEEKLAESGVSPRSREGASKADWVVVDTGDVVAHVFQKRVREFYQLEYLWQDAPQVKWQA